MENIQRNSLILAQENFIVLEAELASEQTAVITYQPEGSEHATPILACITSTASLSIRGMVKAERLDETGYLYNGPTIEC
jgi:hypothetical protein